jgi:hypothetical protein
MSEAAGFLRSNQPVQHQQRGLERTYFLPEQCKQPADAVGLQNRKGADIQKFIGDHSVAEANSCVQHMIEILNACTKLALRFIDALIDGRAGYLLRHKMEMSILCKSSAASLPPMA